MTKLFDFIQPTKKAGQKSDISPAAIRRESAPIHHNLRKSESGNVFFAMVGAVVMVGAIGFTASGIMKGPMSTMANVSQRAEAEAEIMSNLQLATLAVAEMADQDCDKDGSVEPLGWDAGTGPTGGGLLPSSIRSSNSTDPWGTQYGYCVWDHGTRVEGDTASGQECSSGPTRLQGLDKTQHSGAGTASVANQVIIAIISAGADRRFDTVCRNWSAADIHGGSQNGTLTGASDLPLITGGGDDIMLSFNYMEAAMATSSRWKIKDDTNDNDADTTAELDEDKVELGGDKVEIGDSGGIQTGLLDLTLGGLLLPADPGDNSVTGICIDGGLNDSQLRFNSSTTPATMEICSGGAWAQIGGDDGGIPGAPVTTNLTAYFSMDEDSGTTITDDIGSRTGTMGGSMNAGSDTTAGQVGTALDFDGVNDVITVPDSGDLFDLKTNFTVALWVKIDGDQRATIIQKEHNSAPWYSWGIDYDSAGTKRFQFYWVNTISGSGSVDWSTPVTLDQWYHITAVKEGTAVRFYIDGTQVNTGTFTGTEVNGASSLYMGNANTGTYPLDGDLDNIRIYDRALTSAEIVSIFASVGDGSSGGSVSVPTGPGAEIIEDFTTNQTMAQDATTDGTIASYGTIIERESDIHGSEAGIGFLVKSSPADDDLAGAGIAAIRSDINGETGLAFKTQNAAGEYESRAYLDPDGQLGFDVSVPSNVMAALQIRNFNDANWSSNFERGLLINAGPSTVLDTGSISGSSPDFIRTKVMAAFDHSCALKDDDTAWCWGQENSGKLGNNSWSGSETSPVQTTNSGPWIEIGGKHNSTCALKDDGSIWCWGQDANEGLGNGGGGDENNPVQINDADTWIQLGGGRTHYCGIKSDRSAWCWGNNGDGQLGKSSVTLNQGTPVEVDGDYEWAMVTAGEFHSCGIQIDGTAWCWGGDSYNELGNGAAGSQTSPMQVDDADTWLYLSAGDFHTCGIKSDKSLWCWGSDLEGQLGNGPGITDQASPSEILESGPWAHVYAGADHVCGVKTDGTGWCWGVDDSYQIGNGSASSSDQHTPVQITEPGPWNQIIAGTDQTCGVKTDGTAWCWGSDANGKLGNGAAGDQHDPNEVNDAGPWAIAETISNQINGGATFNPEQANCVANNGGPFSEVTRFDTSGASYGVWGDGTYIYVGDGNEIYAFLFDGSTLSEAATLTTPSVAKGIWGDGNYLYVADNTALKAYSFDGSVFTEVGSVASTDIGLRVWSDGTYIYFADDADGIKAYTFNGSAFSSAGSIDTPGQAKNVWGDGTYIYVADGGLGIRIYLHDGSSFSLAGNVDTSGSALGVWSDGSYIYVADGASGIHAYSFNGASFSLIDTYNTTGSAENVWGDGTYIYAADNAGGLYAFSFDGTTLSLVDNDTVPSSVLDVWGDGTYMYAADGSSGLRVYSGFECTNAGFSGTHALSFFGAEGDNNSNATVLFGNNLIIGDTDTDGSSITEMMRLDSQGLTTFSSDFVDLVNSDLITTAQSPLSPNSGEVILNRARGTESAPEDVQDGDITGALTFSGRNSSNITSDANAAIYSKINGAVSAGNTPTDLHFSTDASGSASTSSDMVITTSGNLGIGTTNPTGKAHVAGRIEFDAGLRFGSDSLCSSASDEGVTRYNSGSLEFCDGSSWIDIGSGSSSSTSSGEGSAAVAIETDGTKVLFGWGDNGNSQLGSYNGADGNVPAMVTNIHGVKKAVAGNAASYVLTYTGEIWTWGSRSDYALGDGNNSGSVTVPQRLSHPSNLKWTDVTAGTNAGCAIDSNQDAYCWGDGNNSQMGDGSTSDNTTPNIVSDSYKWASIDGIDWTFCGVTTAGEGYCWGIGTDGQLGNGASSNQNTPQLVSGGHNWRDISVGEHAACGVTIGGDGYCWGSNDRGEIGNGVGSGTYNTPQILSVATTWDHIDVGRDICGVNTDNEMLCWGTMAENADFSGQVIAERASPTELDSSRKWEKVSVGLTSSCALTIEGKVYCWGVANDYRLGNNNNASNQSSPVEVLSDLRFSNISVDHKHVFALTEPERTKVSYAVSWGRDVNNMLGNDSAVSDSSRPVLVHGHFDWIMLDGADDHSCGIVQNGDMYCWGSNNFGEVGDNTNTDRTTPTLVANSLKWKHVTTSQDLSCGITIDGDGYCWGDDTGDAGRVGDGGGGSNQNDPKALNGGLKWLDIQAGLYVVCGVTSNGDGYCWGEETSGELGNGGGTGETVYEPTAVNGGHKWKKIIPSVGPERVTCGLTTAGAAYCWGEDSEGSLGDGAGATANQASPVAVAGGFTFKDIGGGGSHCGIEYDGDAYCWGRGNNGEMGTDIGGSDYFLPTNPVNGSHKWKKIVGGYKHLCGITLQNEVYCWGNNDTGQLGAGFTNTGSTSDTPQPVVTLDTPANLWGADEGGFITFNDYLPAVSADCSPGRLIFENLETTLTNSDITTEDIEITGVIGSCILKVVSDSPNVVINKNSAGQSDLVVSVENGDTISLQIRSPSSVGNSYTTYVSLGDHTDSHILEVVN